MNTILEYGEDVRDIAMDDASTAGYIEIVAEVSACGPTSGAIFTVTTPALSTFPVMVGSQAHPQSLVQVPLSHFSASYGLLPTPVPISVYDSPKLGAPLTTPHVRIILTNAIITKDPKLEIQATIEAFNTGTGKDDMVVVSTPHGSFHIGEGVPVDCIVYSVNQCSFTAKDDQGASVNITWGYLPSLIEQVVFELSALTYVHS